MPNRVSNLGQSTSERTAAGGRGEGEGSMKAEVASRPSSSTTSGCGWLTWIPLLAVAGVVGAMEFLYGGTPPVTPELRRRLAGQLQWLGLSGNAVLLSWTLVCWQASVRRGRLTAIPGENGLMPGLAAVGLHGFWLLFAGEYWDVDELAPLMIILFGPTLVLAFAFLASGIGRLQRMREVTGLAAGLAAVCVLCQWGWGAFRADVPPARLFTLCSLILGAGIGVRLGIWWLTDEGYSDARHA
ncbi:MAG: hypothetical protein KDM81_14835 [Verrucomicrobiae bacterium]|nr:hypothetical protein [Verrucomicrobiae bacterium]